MKVQIEMIPKMNSNIEFAKQVKDIAKELVETCKRCKVDELVYSHDYFKIFIENDNKQKKDCQYTDNKMTKDCQ